MTAAVINQTHCQQCGSTDPQDVDFRVNDGYSGCCNERIVDGGRCDDTCHHAPAKPAVIKPAARKAAPKSRPLAVKAPAATTAKAGPRLRRAAQKPAAGATTRTRTKAAATATAPTGDTLAALAVEIKSAEAALAELTARRNAMIAELISSKTMSGPAVAKALGMTPMGVYNAAKRAGAVTG